MRGSKILRHGRLAQRESAAFTRQRSQVRSLKRPLRETPGQRGFLLRWEPYRLVRWSDCDHIREKPRPITGRLECVVSSGRRSLPDRTPRRTVSRGNARSSIQDLHGHGREPGVASRARASGRGAGGLAVASYRSKPIDSDETSSNSPAGPQNLKIRAGG